MLKSDKDPLKELDKENEEYLYSDINTKDTDFFLFNNNQDGDEK